MQGATLDGQGAESLSARSITVRGNVDLVSNGVFRFEAIGEVCAAHDLWVLCDEVYEDLCFPGVTFEPSSTRISAPTGRSSM